MSPLPRIAQAEAAAHAQPEGVCERFGPLVAAAIPDAAPLSSAWHDGSRAPSPAEWEGFEDFCARHGQAPTLHALSHAAPELLSALGQRGYRLDWVLHVYTHDLQGLPAAPPGAAQTTDALAWAELAARGFGGGTADASTAATMRAVAHAPGKRLWWAGDGGTAVATGAYSLSGGVAALHGAATLPAFRGRGLQTALLLARLVAARAEGASLATVMVTPGTGSERNILRVGFALAGMRLSWSKQP